MYKLKHWRFAWVPSDTGNVVINEPDDTCTSPRRKDPLSQNEALAVAKCDSWLGAGIR